jgi:tight adherence protein B
MTGSGNAGLMLLLCMLSMFLSFLLSVIILSAAMQPRIIAERRLGSLYSKQPAIDDIVPKKKKNKKQSKEKLRFGQTLANELQNAGIIMRPEEFATFWLIASFVPSGLLALLTGNAVLAGAVAIAGIIGPPIYVGKQKKKRISAFEHQLGDALVTMCNCLRSGLTLGQAIENIATDMSEPISKEFSRVCTEIKYGSTLENSLNTMAERIGSDDLSLAVTAINIQRQTGGNLSEILSGISETIRARVKLKADVRVVTASGKASGIVIGVLPIVLGFIIFLVNPDYMLNFIESGAGRVMLIIAAVMETMGFLMIKKILTIKY